ncbi:hypothetical protein [Paenibacillus aceti]|uniref:Uncharacterized protein n=1 Tax=Paenibacillus aceti TaxID=1820010 RepID=A0ABQ1W1E1_9BACL|nr:hypothetical protein [Paenibacillus aceti]GGG08586.1 hypothetical protein GCM10010913_32940 [Paenibacillus aceti]
MNFVKVTEICDEDETIIREGIMLTESVAVSVDLGSESVSGTYLVVERVEEIDGEVYVCNYKGSLLFDVVLPGKISIQKLASMTALEFLAVAAGIGGEVTL